jgi:hypothetical protein
MRREFITGFTALSLFAGSQVWAQEVIRISPDQRTVIKEYVVKEKVKPVVVKERLTVGATVPADVTLTPVPSTWGPSFTRYRYIYSNNNVVLVDPANRHVVEVID